MWVPSLGWEYSLGEGMATHSSLAWRTPVGVQTWMKQFSNMSIPVSQLLPPPLHFPLVTISCFLHLWLNFHFANDFICTIFFKFLFYFLTLQYCIGFAIYQNEKMVTITLYTRQQKRHWCTIIFKKPHINNIIWYLFFSNLLTLLTMIISRSIHEAANDIVLFFPMAEL